MVEGNPRDGAGARLLEDVGRVESAAQAHLQHRDVDLELGEDHQGRQGRRLEESELGASREHVGEHRIEHLVGDGSAVHLNALVEPAEVRGGVEAGALAFRASDGSRHGGDATLAIRSGDMKSVGGALGMAVENAGRAHALETQNRAARCEPVELFEYLMLPRRLRPWEVPDDPGKSPTTLGSPRRPWEVPDGGRGTGDGLRRA